MRQHEAEEGIESKDSKAQRVFILTTIHELAVGGGDRMEITYDKIKQLLPTSRIVTS